MPFVRDFDVEATRQGFLSSSVSLFTRLYIHPSTRAVSSSNCKSVRMGGFNLSFHPSQNLGHSQATSKPGVPTCGSTIFRKIPVIFFEMARWAMSDGRGAPKTLCHEHHDLHSCEAQIRTCRFCRRASEIRAEIKAEVSGFKASHAGRHTRNAGPKRPQSREISDLREQHHSIKRGRPGCFASNRCAAWRDEPDLRMVSASWSRDSTARMVAAAFNPCRTRPGAMPC